MKRNEVSTRALEGKQTRIGKKVGNVVIIMQMISVVLAKPDHKNAEGALHQWHQHAQLCAEPV